MTRRSPLLAFGQAAKDPEAIRTAIYILEKQPKLPSFTVAEAQAIPTSALEAGQMIYVTDETGGAVPAFFDGSGNWRRVTDRNVIS